MDLITRWSLTKRVVATFPALLEWSKSTMKGAMVAQVSEGGDIVRVLDDSQGKVTTLEQGTAASSSKNSVLPTSVQAGISQGKFRALAFLLHSAAVQ